MSDDLIITEEDYAKVKPLNSLPDTILEKTGHFWKQANFPHKIDKTLYDEIYVTSDIHADLFKLNRLLSNAGLIDSSPDATRDTILKPINWLKPKTLLIIIGDLVDGSRDRVSEIPDPIGDIELLLHVFLFNIRQKALQAGSEIRFTIGNHDYHSVVKENSDDLPYFYDSWVHDSAKSFFGSREVRRQCLIPFYLCSPYFIIRIDTELAFVHGGLNSEEGEYVMEMTDAIVEVQEKLDKFGDFASLTDQYTKFISATGKSPIEGGGPLWTRFYSYGNPTDVCDTLGDPFKMVVVGHCQTDTCSKGATMTGILKNPKFASCDGGGCVLLGCDKKEGAPSLAFVDISMSAAFRNPLFNKKPLINSATLNARERERRAELLKFVHDTTLDDSDRYYNKITREKVGGNGPNESLLYWASKAKTAGGKKSMRKTLNIKNKIKKLKRSTNKQNRKKMKTKI